MRVGKADPNVAEYADTDRNEADHMEGNVDRPANLNATDHADHNATEQADRNAADPIDGSVARPADRHMSPPADRSAVHLVAFGRSERIEAQSMVEGINPLFVNVLKRRGSFSLEAHFEIKDEIVALLGPSGSGKTTLLHLIAGLLTPDDGEIRLGKILYYKKGKHPLPIRMRKVGLLFQDYALFPHMTVERNILYGAQRGKRMDDPQIRELLEATGISHLIHQYPNQLSGGEKQRVALVRALAADARLLLLDEPFSALDRRTKEESHEALLRLHSIRRIPLLFVTHDLEEAEKLGNRLMMIERGKVKE